MQNLLETEKIDLLKVTNNFIDNINFEDSKNPQTTGRPRADLRNVIKSLMMTNYHFMSYKRIRSDLEFLKKEGFLSDIPKISTLNRYMQKEEFREILERLIELLARNFIDKEDCLMIDSTQFFNRVLLGGSKCRTKYGKLFQVPSLNKTRKLSVIIAKNSKIIISAKTSSGTVHDNNFFKILLENAMNLGYQPKVLLADSAYNSKDNYVLCENLGIVGFLDFKSNHVISRSKSFLRKKQLIMYRENPKAWKETYRYRVLVESVFSSIKKKSGHFLRSRNETSRDCEMLLKVLWYNLSIIVKYLDDL